MRRLLLALLLGSCLAFAACGEKSLSEARAELVDDCANGSSSDRPLCECVASELSSKHGVKTAARYEQINDQVKDGRSVAAVEQSLRACQASAGGSPTPTASP